MPESGNNPIASLITELGVSPSVIAATLKCDCCGKAPLLSVMKGYGSFMGRNDLPYNQKTQAVPRLGSSAVAHHIVGCGSELLQFFVCNADTVILNNNFIFGLSF